MCQEASTVLVGIDSLITHATLKKLTIKEDRVANINEIYSKTQPWTFSIFASVRFHVFACVAGNDCQTLWHRGQKRPNSSIRIICSPRANGNLVGTRRLQTETNQEPSPDSPTRKISPVNLLQSDFRLSLLIRPFAILSHTARVHNAPLGVLEHQAISTPAIC